MTTDLERIKEKIRALKRLANNSASAVGEVANAMAAATQLANQYNLKLAEIDENEQIKEIRESIINKKLDVPHHRINIGRTMNTKICRFYECELIYNYDWTTMTIVGTESDVELALYAINISHEAMDAGWKKYMQSEDYEDYIEDGFTRSQIRKDFSKGFVLQIIELVNAMQKDKDALKVHTSTGTALIVRKEAEISTEVNRLFPNMKQGRKLSLSITLTGAVNAGKEEGSKVRFNKAVNGRQQGYQCLTQS